MNFESSKSTPQPRSIEYNGKKFEVREPDVLNPQDIEQGDRVLVTTQSGNRYMFRRSRSRGSVLMVANENEDGFQKFYRVYDQNQTLAQKGKSIELPIYTDEVKGLGTKFESTSVTLIEIRKGIDDAINTAPQGTGSVNLFDELKNHAKGKGTL